MDDLHEDVAEGVHARTESQAAVRPRPRRAGGAAGRRRHNRSRSRTDTAGHQHRGRGAGGGQFTGEGGDENEGGAVAGWAVMLRKLPGRVVVRAREKVSASTRSLRRGTGAGTRWRSSARASPASRVPVPGSSLIAAAPVILAAELHRRLSRGVDAALARALMGTASPGPTTREVVMEMTREQIEAEGRKFFEELLAEWPWGRPRRPGRRRCAGGACAEPSL